MTSLASVAQVLHQLETGATTSRSLVDECLSAAVNPAGQGTQTFTRIYTESARDAADNADRKRAQGNRSNLLGLPVSIKDLLAVAGEPNPAGSVVLAQEPIATRDAPVVQRLRDAGAVLVGRTNMTEFAYSGLGLNPHYGTPKNPYDRATGRIPGGSSSGAAVSVSDGMAIAAIGSDTGGSVRIPAALCGLSGFKPTASRVPLEGVVPLSPTLDSIGVIAPTVACCALVDSVIAGEPPHLLPSRDISDLRIGILQGYVLDGLDQAVAQAFQDALATLAARGAHLQDVSFDQLSRIPGANRFAAPEAYKWHRDLLSRDRARYDPRVSVRILPGANVDDAEYRDLFRIRQEIIDAASQAFRGFDAVILPTVPIIAPPLDALATDDAAFFQANGAVLRNPSIFNYLDGCALSIPCHSPGEAPVGLMIAGLSGCDRDILTVGLAIETALRHHAPTA